MAAINPPDISFATHARYVALNPSIPDITFARHSRYAQVSAGGDPGIGISVTEWGSYEFSVGGYLTNSFPVVDIPDPVTFGFPMGRRRIATRITDIAVPIFRWRMEGPGAGTVSKIQSFDLWLPGNLAGATSAIFNMRVNGVNVWAGGARPTIASGSSHVRKSAIDLDATFGVMVEIYAEQIPAAGLDVPIDVLVWGEAG